MLESVTVATAGLTTVEVVLTVTTGEADLEVEALDDGVIQTVDRLVTVASDGRRIDVFE